MKNQRLILFFLSVAGIAYGQNEKSVESKITNVTVFLNRAQITRTIKARVEQGKTSLAVAGLSSQIDPQSIQVAGRGGFVLLGTSHRQNFLNEFNQSKSIKALNDSLTFYQKEILLNQSQKEILLKEEQLILSNQKFGGSNQNITVVELKAMADFFRIRLNELALTRIKLDERISRSNARQLKIQEQLNIQNELLNRNTSEVIIQVSAEVATSVELELSYVVANAGWQAAYDIRAINTTQPIQLHYKANVQQSTGEDWNNVALKLSTLNPSIGGVKPALNTWYLNFFDPNPLYKNAARSAPAAMMKSSVEGIAAEKDKQDNATPLGDFVTTTQTTLATEFDILLPYTVVSSSKPTLVDIKNYNVKADYRYSATPKLDKDAFLLANVIGWEEFNLLPGEATIFFEGTFVGNSFVDPNNVNDTLSVSLGRDKRIVVTREKIKNLTSRNFIGSIKKESILFSISIRNTKEESVKIQLEDQLPISQNSQIEVNAIELSGAKYDNTTGKLLWDIELKPSETKKLIYTFEVKYPKDRQVIGL